MMVDVVVEDRAKYVPHGDHLNYLKDKGYFKKEIILSFYSMQETLVNPSTEINRRKLVEFFKFGIVISSVSPR